HFEWQDMTDAPLVEPSRVPEPAWQFTPCYGSIYRTYDWKPREAADDHGDDEGGADVDDVGRYLAEHWIDPLQGVKLGGRPRWIQDAWYPEDGFLCQLASIWDRP